MVQPIIALYVVFIAGTVVLNSETAYGASSQQHPISETSSGKNESTQSNPSPSVTTLKLRDAMDTTVSPCDDFERYANGRWKDQHRTARIDIFKDVRARVDMRLVALLDTLSRNVGRLTKPEERVLGAFVASCLTADTLPSILPLTPGQLRPTTRPEQCLALADQLLEPALGQVFVAHVMSPGVLTETEQWLEVMRTAIRQQIERLTWVSDSVKQKALAHLAAIEIRLARYPAPVDYRSIQISRTDYVANVAMLTAFEKQRLRVADSLVRMASVEWIPISPPHHFAARAWPERNVMEITAVLFQRPLFDLHAEAAENYAGLGMVLGHEIWHLLTPFFKWSGTDEGRRRVGEMVERYVGFSTSGWSTVNEDLGDIGGILAAYDAWTQHTRSSESVVVERFTPEQRFFLYYARVWRNPNPEQNDTQHSGPRARVNGVLMHVPAFAKAFGCKVGDPMVPMRNPATDIFATARMADDFVVSMR